MTDDFELTKTEKIVYELLLQGYDTKEISEKLFISLPTSKAHRNSILKKTKAKSIHKLLAKEVITMNKELELVKDQYDKLMQQNKSLQKNLKLLNEMLNIAITVTNKNELCSYCRYNNNCYRDSNNSICINGILGVLENVAMDRLTKKEPESEQ